MLPLNSVSTIVMLVCHRTAAGPALGNDGPHRWLSSLCTAGGGGGGGGSGGGRAAAPGRPRERLGFCRIAQRLGIGPSSGSRCRHSEKSEQDVLPCVNIAVAQSVVRSQSRSHASALEAVCDMLGGSWRELPAQRRLRALSKGPVAVVRVGHHVACIGTTAVQDCPSCFLLRTYHKHYQIQTSVFSIIFYPVLPAYDTLAEVHWWRFHISVKFHPPFTVHSERTLALGGDP